jgi:hypothetical protein
LFNNSDAVVGVYDLIADVENAVAVHGGALARGKLENFI